MECLELLATAYFKVWTWIGHGGLMPDCRQVACPPRAAATSLRLTGDAASHSEEPGAEQLWLADPARFASQDQKCGLKGVLGGLHITEELPAHLQDHRTVAVDQCRESRLGGLIAASQEPLEELPIRDPRCGSRDEQGLDRVRNALGLALEHRQVLHQSAIGSL